MKNPTLAAATADAARRPAKGNAAEASGVRKTIVYRAEPVVARQLKLIAFQEETTLQALIGEGVNAVLTKRGMPPVA